MAIVERKRHEGNNSQAKIFDNDNSYEAQIGRPRLNQTRVNHANAAAQLRQDESELAMLPSSQRRRLGLS